MKKNESKVYTIKPTLFYKTIKMIQAQLFNRIPRGVIRKQRIICPPNIIAKQNNTIWNEKYLGKYGDTDT